jgi:hypothetical protein
VSSVTWHRLPPGPRFCRSSPATWAPKMEWKPTGNISIAEASNMAGKSLELLYYMVVIRFSSFPFF